MNRGTTQKIVITLVIVIITAGLLYFIYRTSKAYISGPSIEITGPANYAAFYTSTTTVAGIATRAQNITLDGRSITIDNKGNFSETILLMPGYNIETVAAQDQFGHTTKEELNLVYVAPKTTASTTNTTSTTTESTTTF